MTELFFELIRLAIGTQERLSRVPSKKEWGRLFKMAERQRLLGICFYGVKKVASPIYDNEASPKYDNEASPQPSPEGKGEEKQIKRTITQASLSPFPSGRGRG